VKNRTLGSIFIVAGTTIGAGMLAMPLAAAGVGFGVTVVLLGGLWALMCYTALLLLEVYQHVPADTGLGSLAARYLGRYGQWITGFSMMFLMYALTAAYISGAGELIASSINDGFGASLSPETGAIVFTLIGGGVVCAGTSLVDLFNRFLFSAKNLFLIVMLVRCWHRMCTRLTCSPSRWRKVWRFRPSRLFSPPSVFTAACRAS